MCNFSCPCCFERHQLRSGVFWWGFIWLIFCSFLQVLFCFLLSFYLPLAIESLNTLTWKKPIRIIESSSCSLTLQHIMAKKNSRHRHVQNKTNGSEAERGKLKIDSEGGFKIRYISGVKKAKRNLMLGLHQICSIIDQHSGFLRINEILCSLSVMETIKSRTIQMFALNLK